MLPGNCHLQTANISTAGISLLLFVVLLIGDGSSRADDTPQPAVNGASAPETVVLDNREYPVPLPWTGNRIAAPSLSPADFRQIPPEYTKNGKPIYILDSIHDPLVAMLEAADRDGVQLLVSSGYRSIEYQSKIFLRLFAEGRTFDDIIRYVAPPGYSQHMLGIAVDFSPSNWRYAATAQYAWLKAHAQEFGFTETYAKSNRLQMPWESWHWAFENWEGQTGQETAQFP